MFSHSKYRPSSKLARFWRGACYGVGFAASTVFLFVMIWILWCYLGFTSLPTAIPQRRAIVDYGTSSSKPIEATPSTPLGIYLPRNSTSSSQTNVPQVRGGSLGETQGVSDQRRDYATSRREDGLAKGDFNTRDKSSPTSNSTNVYSRNTVGSRDVNSRASIVVSTSEYPTVRSLSDENAKRASAKGVTETVRTTALPSATESRSSVDDRRFIEEKLTVGNKRIDDTDIRSDKERPRRPLDRSEGRSSRDDEHSLTRSDTKRDDLDKRPVEDTSDRRADDRSVDKDYSRDRPTYERAGYPRRVYEGDRRNERTDYDRKEDDRRDYDRKIDDRRYDPKVDSRRYYPKDDDDSRYNPKVDDRRYDRKEDDDRRYDRKEDYDRRYDRKEDDERRYDRKDDDDRRYDRKEDDDDRRYDRKEDDDRRYDRKEDDDRRYDRKEDERNIKSRSRDEYLSSRERTGDVTERDRNDRGRDDRDREYRNRDDRYKDDSYAEERYRSRSPDERDRDSDRYRRRYEDDRHEARKGDDGRDDRYKSSDDYYGRDDRYRDRTADDRYRDDDRSRDYDRRYEDRLSGDEDGRRDDRYRSRVDSEVRRREDVRPRESDRKYRDESSNTKDRTSYRDDIGSETSTRFRSDTSDYRSGDKDRNRDDDYRTKGSILTSRRDDDIRSGSTRTRVIDESRYDDSERRRTGLRDERYDDVYDRPSLPVRRNSRDDYVESRSPVNRDDRTRDRERPVYLEEDRPSSKSLSSRSDDISLNTRSYLKSDEDYVRNRPRTDSRVTDDEYRSSRRRSDQVERRDRDDRYEKNYRDRSDYGDDVKDRSKGEYVRDHNRDRSYSRIDDDDRYSRRETRYDDRYPPDREVRWRENRTDDGDRRIEPSKTIPSVPPLKSSMGRSSDAYQTEPKYYDDEYKRPPRRKAEEDYSRGDSYSTDETRIYSSRGENRSNVRGRGSEDARTPCTKRRNSFSDEPEGLSFRRIDDDDIDDCDKSSNDRYLPSTSSYTRPYEERRRSPSRSLTPKEIIDEAYRHTEEGSPRKAIYPVYDPRNTNMTSPEVIRPNERRGTTITARRRRRRREFHMRK